MTGATVRSAPGKLFVAGEYAVLEPGSPAVLAAVDRQVTVAVTPADDDLVVVSDLTDQVVRLSRTAGGFPQDAEPRPVVSAVEVVGALLAEWGLSLPGVALSIRSGLHSAGTKFGLGSSGAVAVATIDALLAHCGVSLCTEERFRLALLAAARIDPRASGGDLAASTWGGWVLYRAPDRAAVLDLARRKGIRHALEAPWPGFEVRRLPPPRGLVVSVGWTGRPASTSDRVAGARCGPGAAVTRTASSCGAATPASPRWRTHWNAATTSRCSRRSASPAGSSPTSTPGNGWASTPTA